MPFHWVRIPSSDPEKRRAAGSRICKRHNATLCCDDQIFYDRQGEAYALVKLPDDPDPCDEGALLRDLRAIKVMFLVNATEQKALVPAKSRRAPRRA
jgi:hypothetical protein